MEFYLKKCFKPVFVSFLFLFSTFLFSCSGFINGSELKKAIEKEIAINTAPSITVRLSSEVGTGVFPSAKDLSVKVGYNFSVEFILNSSNYVFNKWTFSDAKDLSKNLEEHIKYETNVSENTYTLDISINKQIDNLLIKPDCILIPKAVKQLPEMIEEGKPQDSSISVNFNTPVNPKDFEGTFKNVSIKSGGAEIAADYFYPPVLSADKKTLTIKPIESKKLIENTSENGTRDITVTLLTGKSVDGNGKVIREPLLNGEGNCNFYNDISWTYRVNQTQDGEAPVIHSISLFADSEGKCNISKGHFIYWTRTRDEEGKNDYDRHHVRELFVKINGSDVGGGIRCLKVTELMVQDKSAKAVNSEEKISYFADCSFENDVLIPLAFSNVDDGLVSLKFSVLDYAGNESDFFTYYVIKDTSFESSLISAKLINKKTVFDTDFSAAHKKTGDYEYREADENGIDTVQIDCSNTYKYFYGEKDCPIFISVESSYDGENFSEENITKDSNFLFTLKRKAEFNTYVRISCEDDVGNKNSVVRVIPKTIAIVEKPETRNVGTAPLRDCFVFTATDLKDLYNLKDSIDAKNGMYSFFYKKDTPESEILYNNRTGVDISGNYYGGGTENSFLFWISTKDATDGTKSKCYLNPQTNYCFYASYTYRYGTNDYWNGCIGKPYKLKLKSSYNPDDKKFYYEIITPSGTVSEEAIPESFDVDILPAEKNKGKRTVRVKFNSGFTPDPECSYIIEYKNYQYSFYSDKLEFDVPSGYKYTFYLIVRDKNGNTYKSTTGKTIDATEDNISPSVYALAVGMNSKVLEPSKIRLSGITRILDNGQVTSGLYKKNGLIPFTYFVVKNQNQEKSDVINLSLDELYADYVPKKVYFKEIAEKSNSSETDGSFMDFYFDEKEEGGYSIFIEAKDASNLQNTSLISFYIDNTTLKTQLAPKFSFDSSNIVIEIKVDPLTFYLAGLRESDNNWIRSEPPTLDDKSWTVDSTYNGSFLKVAGRGSGGLYDVVYYSTVNLDSLNPALCENKNLLKCESGYQVFADNGKPVFIHTMVSKYNYGTEKQDWYNKAIETNLKVKKEGGNFSYHPDFEHYPEDYWMTVIVHFADDDAIMSYPMQIKDYR